MTTRRRLLLWVVSASLVPIYLYYFGSALDQFRLPWPEWIGWAGDILLAVSVGIFIWSHLSLGHAWTAAVDVAEGQSLVTEGPYRWVRHPMYSALLMSLGLMLATGNPVVALPYGVSIAVLYFERVRDEELMMRRVFGSEYDQYCKRTGRLIPRFPNSRHSR